MPSSELYVTLAEFKAYVGKTETAHDTSISTFEIPGVCRLIDNHCGRMEDGFVSPALATARIFSGSGKKYQWIPECTVISLVEVKESVTDTAYTAWAAGDWRAFTGDPNYPDFNTLPYSGIMIDPTGSKSHFISGLFSYMEGFPPDESTSQIGRGAPTVRVTAKWGYASVVPDVVKNATMIELSRWWKQEQSAWADTIANPELQRLQFTQGLHPATIELLDNSGLVRKHLPGIS